MILIIIGLILYLLLFIIIIGLLIYVCVIMNIHSKNFENILDRLPHINKKFKVNNMYNIKHKDKTLSLIFKGKTGNNKGDVDINLDGKSEGFGKNKWIYNMDSNILKISWSDIIKDIFDVYNINVNPEFIFNSDENLVIYFSYKNKPRKICLQLNK